MAKIKAGKEVKAVMIGKRMLLILLNEFVNNASDT